MIKENIVKKLFNFFRWFRKPIEKPIEFIFNESYRISTQEMLDLIKRVSKSAHWVDALKKDSDSLVAAVRMTKMQGGMIDNNRLHVGYCYHDVEQVMAYLIQDKFKDQTLFCARKYDYEKNLDVVSFVPGNWIDYLKKIV